MALRRRNGAAFGRLEVGVARHGWRLPQSTGDQSRRRSPADGPNRSREAFREDPSTTGFHHHFIGLPRPHLFLTHPDPVSMVRAALGRWNLCDLPAGVEAWPTTHAKMIMSYHELMRLRSPRGFSVSANG